MNQFSRPNPRPHQNNQATHASHGGTANVNQNGYQQINTTNNQYNNNTTNQYNNHLTVRTRSRTGWAILVILVVDVGFFFYGQAAYTGGQGDSGDLWRAGIFFALLLTTGSLIRRWFRAR